jgi:hypothetical protein
MKNTHLHILSFCTALILSACNNGNSGSTTQDSRDSSVIVDSIENAKTVAPKENMVGEKLGEKGGIQVYCFTGSPDFPDAGLKLENPAAKALKDGDKVPFKFAVSNYELTKQTEGNSSCNCNNSAKGQHIHLILNNKPYKALYKPDFDTALAPGHYVAVAFLSRSYHESVKGKNAFQVTQFNVGPKKEKDMDLAKPMLIYSRPKGEYKGKDTTNILLDFYLLNTDLSETGNKVMATINGQPFPLTKWTGYALKGLKLGKNTIKLELMDKGGKLIPGDYNSVEREITLKE